VEPPLGCAVPPVDEAPPEEVLAPPVAGPPPLWGIRPPELFVRLFESSFAVISVDEQPQMSSAELVRPSQYRQRDGWQFLKGAESIITGFERAETSEASRVPG